MQSKNRILPYNDSSLDSENHRDNLAYSSYFVARSTRRIQRNT